ncbi:MAG: glucose-1-phosphate thymidylyltransferase [Crenarchaeota archaeon]|nr:MAG: glucose-1-phosphate thymidylyltransferase [Thermoproteota archaeon]RDJ33320.1 MAG: glucose-1-phosphate thymidylyltransferase [Thermoproteota archaeon]RDJ36177.1 MAG: glucose-1-phosphate thymidylyltransferase [Thermoproteota archaeon]RDJ38808.1 MAG: glucose-1-phosphate thymidylyltransferase [Thermoproteota archaeon]
MKGIILHGGHGTRLRPLTHTGPKQLLPIANKPMSQYCLESLRDAGIIDVAIIIGGNGSEKVKEYYGSGEKFGVKISYIEQDLPRGIAHAVGLCESFVSKDKFIVFLGDNLIQKKINRLVDEFSKSDNDASILLCEVDNPTRFGIADVNDGRIKKIIEKPKNPPSNLAVTGIYFLTESIFQVIKKLKPSWRNEFEITDALQLLLDEGKKISYNIVTDYWKDTGTPEDIIHANKTVLNNLEPYFYGIKEEGVKLSGKIFVGKNTVIKKDTQIEGPVIVGDDCEISNARIGPNTSIGDKTKISKCSIRDTIVMSNCDIDSELQIRNSIIAKNSSIKTKTEKDGEKQFLLGEGTKILF